jgi:hypothetical protein
MTSLHSRFRAPVKRRRIAWWCFIIREVLLIPIPSRGLIRARVGGNLTRRGMRILLRGLRATPHHLILDVYLETLKAIKHRENLPENCGHYINVYYT